MMRSPRTSHASPPRRVRGSRTDCAVCRCAGDRQLGHFRAAVGNRADGDGILARRLCAAAAGRVGGAGTARARRRDATRRDARGRQLARSDVFLGRSVVRRRSCLVARVAPAHFGRRLDAGGELRAHGRDARAWALWGERPRLSFLLALALASVGLLLIVSTKFAHGPPALAGDLLGLGTACFYGFYILAVARLRIRYGAGIVMFNSTLVFTLLLLPLALTQGERATYIP